MALLGSYPATSRLEHRPTTPTPSHDYMQPSRAVRHRGPQDTHGLRRRWLFSVCISPIDFECVCCVCDVCVY